VGEGGREGRKAGESRPPPPTMFNQTGR